MKLIDDTLRKNETLKIKVWIDFVCPYCLLGKKVLEEAASGLDVNIEMMPFELRAYPAPTLRPEDEYLPSVWKHGVYPAAEKLDIAIKLPSVSPQPYTRDAFLVLQYAKDQGVGNEYADAMLRAFFQQDRDIGDLTVIKDVAASVGLPIEPLEEIPKSPLHSLRHDNELKYASRIDIRAVPNIAIGNKIYSGMLDSQELRAVILANMPAGKVCTSLAE